MLIKLGLFFFVCVFLSRSADDDKENCALDNSPELDKTKGQLAHFGHWHFFFHVT